MARIVKTAVLGLLLSTAAAAPALAQDDMLYLPPDSDPTMAEFNRDVFFFGGRFHGGNFFSILQPWQWYGLPENNYVLGGGFQQFYAHPGAGLHHGAEFGLAGRFANDGVSVNSLETWFGYVLRWDGWTLGDTFRITPALTAGISLATAPIGAERDRAINDGLNPSVLFYLGPEISLTYLPMPNVEAFFRIQHRSGLYGVIAPLDGSNAQTVGVRFKFE